MIKYKLSRILEKSKGRPDGYYEDVVSRGNIVNDYLEISQEEVNKLKEKYDPPSLMKQVANVAKSTFNHIAGGMEQVSNDIYEERLKICQGCPFYNTDNPENPRCNKCGCYLKIKARWATESCPDEPKKWNSIPTQKNGGCGSCGGN